MFLTDISLVFWYCNLTDFTVVFKPGVSCVSWNGGFAVLAGVLAKLSGDLYLFGRVQDTVVEPHLSRFRCAGRHAGLGGGLMLRMAVMICPNSAPLTATSASWKVILRAWRTTRAPILIRRLWMLVSDQSATSFGRSAKAADY